MCVWICKSSKSLQHVINIDWLMDLQRMNTFFTSVYIHRSSIVEVDHVAKKFLSILCSQRTETISIRENRLANEPN